MGGGDDHRQGESTYQEWDRYWHTRTRIMRSYYIRGVRACDASRAKGESSGRKWGTGQGGEKRGKVSGVLSASLPLLAQEDP
eukprot:1176091-Prorocentrum_minimum.AAC.2